MKTVSFDDDAYNLLKGAKVSPAESFSDVVKRMLGARRSVTDSAGGWADMSDKEAKSIRRETVESFGTTRE